MKKNVLNTIILFIAGIILYSCSEDPVKPPPTTNNTNKYFPLFEGTWWTYTNYELDENGDKVATSEFSSKYIIGGTDSLGGKKAFRFDIQDLAGVKIEDSKYFYATKSQIFEFSKLLPPMDFSMPLDIPETWYKIADNGATKWTLFFEDMDKVQFQFSGFDIFLDDTFEIIAEKEGIEDVTYGTNMDKTVSAQKYKISFTFGGNALVSGVIPIEIPFTVESIYYYSENIGMVKHVMNPMTIVIQGTEYFRMNGSRQILLDYNIAQ